MLFALIGLALPLAVAAGPAHSTDTNALSWSTVGDCNDPTSLLTNARELKGGAVVVFEDYLHYLADENGELFRFGLFAPPMHFRFHTEPSLDIASARKLEREADGLR